MDQLHIVQLSHQSGWNSATRMQELNEVSAQVNASNNAGDRPWHWAWNMDHKDIMAVLEMVSPGHPVLSPYAQ
jgi:hypothetical protein